jgi:hypothetical protein
MKKSFLLIGAAAAATLIAGGWAFAQSHGPGFGPAFMWGQGHAGMGPGMMQHMGRGMGRGMGHGMGPGMSPAMMQQGGAGFGAGMGAGMMHGDPGQMLADPAQLDRLKNELGITPAQEEAWKEYANAVKDAADKMTAMHESMGPGAVRDWSPADRFAFMTSTREELHTRFQTVQAAVNELLATLDDTQKAKAQERLAGLAFGPGMMNAAHMGGPHHY